MEFYDGAIQDMRTRIDSHNLSSLWHRSGTSAETGREFALGTKPKRGGRNNTNMTRGMKLALGIEVTVTFTSLRTWTWRAEREGT